MRLHPNTRRRMRLAREKKRTKTLKYWTEMDAISRRVIEHQRQGIILVKSLVEKEAGTAFTRHRDTDATCLRRLIHEIDKLIENCRAREAEAIRANAKCRDAEIARLR